MAGMRGEAARLGVIPSSARFAGTFSPEGRRAQISSVGDVRFR